MRESEAILDKLLANKADHEGRARCYVFFPFFSYLAQLYVHHHERWGVNNSHTKVCINHDLNIDTK